MGQRGAEWRSDDSSAYGVTLGQMICIHPIKASKLVPISKIQGFQLSGALCLLCLLQRSILSLPGCLCEHVRGWYVGR